MPDICIYFQGHQPYRAGRFSVFDVGNKRPRFDDALNRSILVRVADKCYRPATRALLDLIQRTGGEFKVSFSLSGVLIEQLREWAPDVLDQFRALGETGAVEFIGETYYHSLAALISEPEFAAQVTAHSVLMETEFGVRPRTFRNTELIYWSGLAPAIRRLGFDVALVEGADFVLQGRSPNHLYADRSEGLLLLPRNYRLSDDVGFRFSNRSWEEWPLTAEKYAGWLDRSYGDSVHLFMDFETFGEHHWQDTGIFRFLEALPAAARRYGMPFKTPSELAARTPAGALQFDRPVSWADMERDTSAWLGNRIQQSAHRRLYELLPQIIHTGDERILADWRKLSTSDHFYYACTKWFSDGDVHRYFNPYDSPYDAFISYMNVLADLALQAVAKPPAASPSPATFS